MGGYWWTVAMAMAMVMILSMVIVLRGECHRKGKAKCQEKSCKIHFIKNNFSKWSFHD
jgi:hypothetical protein